MSQARNFADQAAVLIVEDHTPMRGALRACIERSFSGLSIIEAADRATALKCVEVQRPSLVLVDINLPYTDGLDLTRDIMKLRPTTLVTAMSDDSGADIPARARAAGAVDLISKDKLLKSLVPLVGAALTLANWMNSFNSDCMVDQA